MSCAICGRAYRGFGFTARRRDAPRQLACSMRCLDILNSRGGAVYDLNHFEKQAVEAASDKAGAYLEEIGKTDLSTLTGEEWRQLLSTVFVAATAQIQRLTDEDAVPF